MAIGFQLSAFILYENDKLARLPKNKSDCQKPMANGQPPLHVHLFKFLHSMVGGARCHGHVG